MLHTGRKRARESSKVQSLRLRFRAPGDTMVTMRVAGGTSPWVRVFLFACFTIATGCGDSGKGDDGVGGNGSSGVTLQPMVDAECAWEKRCGPGPCYLPVCDAPIFRAEAVTAAVRCFETLACDGDSDQCAEVAAWNQVPNAEADISSCLNRYSASCPEYSDIDVSLCLGYPLLIPSKKAEFDQCFEQGTCAEPCLIAIGSLCTPQE